MTSSSHLRLNKSFLKYNLPPDVVEELRAASAIPGGVVSSTSSESSALRGRTGDKFM
jgi:hypothetical protein